MIAAVFTVSARRVASAADFHRQRFAHIHARVGPEGAVPPGATSHDEAALFAEAQAFDDGHAAVEVAHRAIDILGTLKTALAAALWGAEASEEDLVDCLARPAPKVEVLRLVNDAASRWWSRRDRHRPVVWRSRRWR